MCKFFDDWSTDIKDYCQNNNLDFEKAKKLSRCWGNNFLVLQYHDKNKQTKGLLDETPMPIVLVIEKKNSSLIFTQTEHTKKYLHKVS